MKVAQQAAEESQQQNLAWQQQLWWAARDKLQEINNCWAAKLDAVTRQHQQLEQACEEQQMLLQYYRRGMLADPCLAMQDNGYNGLRPLAGMARQVLANLPACGSIAAALAAPHVPSRPADAAW
jgi:hypothetical protein